MQSHIINVEYSIVLRFKEDKFSCTLLESNELISFEKNLRGAGRRFGPLSKGVFSARLVYRFSVQTSRKVRWRF